MNRVSQKKRSGSSKVMPTSKVPRMSPATVPKLPEMSNLDKTTPLEFDPLLLRYGVNNRRCQAPTSYPNQTLKSFQSSPTGNMVSKKATPTRNVFEVSKSDKVAPMKSTPSPKLPESAFMTSSLGNKTQSNSTTRGIIFGTGHSRQNNMVLSCKNMQSGPSSDKSQPPPDHVGDVRPHHNHDKNGEGMHYVNLTAQITYYILDNFLIFICWSLPNRYLTFFGLLFLPSISQVILL
ncbi:unnamed protein product [Cuscuta europaea]|uniref:Uncharacterized protein n=1 Tax=Cuscuta europaea TaxID=41803 RepID=A0A9P1E8J0_CUSEU|nr:unnamed protein product [Cuscuta europaea]